MTQITTQKYAEKYEEALGFTLDTIFKDIEDHPSVAREVLVARTLNEWFNVGTKNEDPTGQALGLPASTNRFQTYGNITNYFNFGNDFKPKNTNLADFHDFLQTLYVGYLIDKKYDETGDLFNIFQKNSILTAQSFISHFDTKQRVFSYNR